MKWSWKAFGLYLIADLALATALAYAVSSSLDAAHSPDAPDSTLAAMRVGSFATPAFIALLVGWKGWSWKPLLWAGSIVAFLFFGNLGYAIAASFFAALSCYVASKARIFVGYYFS